jgi:hypothetical protein
MTLELATSFFLSLTRDKSVLKSALNEIHRISVFHREVVENCALLAITQRLMAIPYRRFGTAYYYTLRNSP